jgi:hypothetical protein
MENMLYLYKIIIYWFPVQQHNTSATQQQHAVTLQKPPFDWV